MVLMALGGDQNVKLICFIVALYTKRMSVILYCLGCLWIVISSWDVQDSPQPMKLAGIYQNSNCSCQLHYISIYTHYTYWCRLDTAIYCVYRGHHLKKGYINNISITRVLGIQSALKFGFLRILNACFYIKLVLLIWVFTRLSCCGEYIRFFTNRLDVKCN